jgi:hypothetical protein
LEYTEMDDEDQLVHIRKRCIQDAQNPFGIYEENEFRKRYRSEPVMVFSLNLILNLL